MDYTNEEMLLLEKKYFSKEVIEKRMELGNFKSKQKFELFIWDLEIFLQLQKILGDNIILKGGAATQFHIPIEYQRTSIDIDMICLSSREEVSSAIKQIESNLHGGEDYFIFKKYIPKKPKLGLDNLDTYFVRVPTICSSQDLYSTRGKQEVKVEFIYSKKQYLIEKITGHRLFALETKRTFNILCFNHLIADKMTTIGPNTIGISYSREDEQYKQLYDVITLFLSNKEKFISDVDIIRKKYDEVAKEECKIHNIVFDSLILYEDMLDFIRKIESIEENDRMYQIAKDFQALYLRNITRRNKSSWALVGYQLELIVEYVFKGNSKIVEINEIEKLINRLQHDDIRGPERGIKLNEVRNALINKFIEQENLSTNLFRKKTERIIWELIVKTSFKEVIDALEK